jgi:putative SOS response-associated peptidase YedK
VAAFDAYAGWAGTAEVSPGGDDPARPDPPEQMYASPMCGRFTQRISTSEMAAIFGAQDRLDDEGAHFNVAPTQSIAVVVERPTRERAIVGYRWGLVPSWTDRGVRAPARMFNARSETAAVNPAFRGLLARHRLIVPADGFYEWRRGPDLARQPFYIRRVDGRPLALAGLWASRHDPEAPKSDPERSATILTTASNALLAQIHGRMPVILNEFDWDRWLDPKLTDLASLVSLLRPAPEDTLEALPVGPAVNSGRSEGRELIEPVGPALVS